MRQERQVFERCERCLPCLVQTRLHAQSSAAQLLLLASDEVREDLEKLQVALGCHIVVAGELGQVLLTLDGHHLVDLHAHQRLGGAEKEDDTLTKQTDLLLYSHSVSWGSIFSEFFRKFFK